jgi:Tol biopolymer transport system component
MKGGLIDAGGLKQLGARRLLPTRTGVPGAGNPAWSPDGRSIALVSGPPDGPHEGPYGIYVATSSQGPARRLVGGMDSVGPLAWSPDSRWLVGEVDPPDGPDGLWLVDATTGKLSLVVAGDDFGTATWLPDGRTIVVGTGIYAYVPGAAAGSRPGLAVIKLAALPA